MKLLLLLLTAFMTLSSVFDWDPGPMTGVKIKNALLYLLCIGLFMNIAKQGRVRLQLPAIHIAFVFMIGYAIASYAAILLVIHYPHYDALDNGLLLKGMVDQMLFFIVFFYGVKDEKEAILVLHFLAACWALSHLVAVLDASGIVHIGDLQQRDDGRVNGTIGESNQYGAFVAMSLPAMIAAAVLSKGARRLFWICAALFTAVTLLLTVSRGAFVATAMACIAAAIMYKKYLPAKRLALWGGSLVIILIFAVITANALGFGDLLYARLVGQTNTGDMSTTSSGRVDFWMHALRVMADQPITFLTGYGWRAYWTMPFRYSPHNFYLSSWFNLGIVGLASGLVLLFAPVREAYAAIERVSARGRIVLIGFTVGSIAFAVATFFVDLFVPWLYYWAYAGLALRIAVNAKEAPAPAISMRVNSHAPRTRIDPFGWVGSAQRR